MLNVEFFAEFLFYYEPLTKLDKADADDMLTFLADWYPRKTTWASPYNTKSYMGSFRKLFKFLVESGRVEKKTEQEIREMLKEGKEEIMGAVNFEDDDDDGWW